jgi:CelD/BcsL family acetyltransferase involved in cellulose biosynthesis
MPAIFARAAHSLESAKDTSEATRSTQIGARHAKETSLHADGHKSCVRLTAIERERVEPVALFTLVEVVMLLNTAVDLPESTPDVVLRREVRRIDSVSAMMVLREAWCALVADTEDCPANLTFEYCELAASRVFDKGGVVNVAMVFRDRELLALWPVSIIRKGPVRIAQAPTCGSREEYGGPLVKAGASSAVYATVAAAIMRVDADVLEIPMVRKGSALQRAFDAARQSWVLARLPVRWRRLPGYSISLRQIPRWDAFFATLPKSLRTSLRYRRKRLDARGQAEFGWCRTIGDAVAVLTWLFDNKRRWARSRGLYAPYLRDNEVRDFFIALAYRTDLTTTPLVSFVKVDGIPVAASVNLVGPHSLEGFISTYDEAFSACSVGNLHAEFLAKWCHANGRDLDLRPFFADYKTGWANRQTWHETLVIFLAARGRLAELSLLSAQLARFTRSIGKAAYRPVLGARDEAWSNARIARED